MYILIINAKFGSLNKVFSEHKIMGEILKYNFNGFKTDLHVGKLNDYTF